MLSIFTCYTLMGLPPFAPLGRASISSFLKSTWYLFNQLRSSLTQDNWSKASDHCWCRQRWCQEKPWSPQVHLDSLRRFGPHTYFGRSNRAPAAASSAWGMLTSCERLYRSLKSCNASVLQIFVLGQLLPEESLEFSLLDSSKMTPAASCWIC